MHREVEYKLKEKNAEGKKATYSGTVKLKLLPFKERNKMMKQLNIKTDQAEAELNDNLDMLDRFADVVKENLLSMDVKKGKTVFKGLEDIDFDDSVAEFYGEVGSVVVSGINLGKI